MNEKLKPADVKLEQVAGAVLGRRRLIKNLAVLAGAGTLAATAYGKGGTGVSPQTYCPPGFVCDGGFQCTGQTFVCASFTCSGGYGL